MPDPEKTPVVCHPRPIAPVVVRTGTVPRQPPPLPKTPPPRVPTAPGGTLAPLGRLPPPLPAVAPPIPGAFTSDERPTQRGQRMAIMSKILRTCDALPIEDLSMLLTMALRLRPGIGEQH